MLIPLILTSNLILELSAQVLQLKSGKINGFQYVTKDGHIAEVFLNIPYAAPPVDQLRFEKPRPVIPWDIRNGTKYGPSCYMLTAAFASSDVEISEDCLTLNIIRSKKERPPSGFPILFWIHGGAFEYGSAPMYGYKSFADFYIPNDIIVVTVQYRLGVYGFFSTADERMPGNLGLYDMAEALKFVHSNAENFGGDASRITVWGESAGAAAAGQLILSPITRDYIAQSIEMSGSPWCSWALGASVPNNSLQLAKIMNCTTDIKKCMKQKSAEEINEAVRMVCTECANSSACLQELPSNPLPFSRPKLDLLRLYCGFRFKHPKMKNIDLKFRFLRRINSWGPVIDGEFLRHPDKMSTSAPRKASIVGLTKKEAALFSLGNVSSDMHLHIKPETFLEWNREKLITTLQRLTETAYSGKHLGNIVDEVIAFYVDRREHQSYEFYISRYTEFLSDLMFNVATVEGISARSDAGWNIYAYVLDHYNGAIWSDEVPKSLRGASHASEHPYAIGDIFCYKKFEFDENERVVADVFRQSIVEFVRNGTPLNSHKDWPNVGEKLRYLRISPKPEVKSGFFNESTSFWRRMRKYGFNMAQLLPTDDTRYSKQEL